jgi:hypothetical protein
VAENIVREFIKSITEVPALLKKGATFCLDLSVEILKGHSEHFEKVDSHYEIDGLLCTYKCKVDGRKYFVKITPERDRN